MHNVQPPRWITLDLDSSVTVRVRLLLTGGTAMLEEI